MNECIYWTRSFSHKWEFKRIKDWSLTSGASKNDAEQRVCGCAGGVSKPIFSVSLLNGILLWKNKYVIGWLHLNFWIIFSRFLFSIFLSFSANFWWVLDFWRFSDSFANSFSSCLVIRTWITVLFRKSNTGDIVGEFCQFSKRGVSASALISYVFKKSQLLWYLFLS